MPPAVAADRWFPSVGEPTDRETALFCLPYAGGSSAAFRGWADRLGPHVAVLPAQLPGRETRITEPPHLDVATVTGALLATVHRRGARRPFALYGHSMGAKLAFEVVRELRRRGEPLPVRLMVGGSRAPHRDTPTSRIATLPDEQFCERLVAMGGTPPGVLDDPELRALLLPALRADFALVESYRYSPDEPIPVPVVAFAGTDDPDVDARDMVGWSAHTTGPFELHTLPGDHFFLHSARAALLGVVAAHLDAGRAGPTAGTVRTVPPATDEVCVLEARLDELPALCSATALLSPAEARRVASCRTPLEAARLTGRSVLLRRTLAGLGVDVGTAELPRGPGGKPAVPHREGLRFGAAHGGGIALVAVTRGREVGVDVEPSRPGACADVTAGDWLDAAETAELAALPPADVAGAALRLRTAKDAVRKAAGDLSVPRRRCGFAGQAGARTWRPGTTVPGLSGWRVRHLDLAGAVAALAVGSDDYRLRYEVVRGGAR